ncbi:MAG: hypothetical protein ACR2PX_01590 [Endozoicomonas sp.]
MHKGIHKLAHINPDHYLQTEQGRLWTPERSQQAWKQAYSDFEYWLSKLTVPLFILFSEFRAQESRHGSIDIHPSSPVYTLMQLCPPENIGPKRSLLPDNMQNVLWQSG